MVNTNRILSSTIVVAGLIAMMMLIIINSNGSSSDKSFQLIEMSYGQSNSNTATNSTALPVLLIHGYMEDAAVWNKWVDLLKKDDIAVYPITFKQSDDKCGSSAQHAKELSNIIGQIKEKTGQNKVNIVGHSKGGLDARVYLANNTKDVANLIMIGTPNAGSPLAESSEECKPAVYDLRPGAAATEVKKNPNTKYYTIAGDWNPKSGNCQLTLALPFEQSSSSKLPKPNDGMVPLSSVESRDYFINLGHSKSCHTNLMSEYEYGLAKDVIVEGKSNQTGTQQQGGQQQDTSEVVSNASQSVNKTDESIQGNASEFGAKASKGAQKLGENITEGAKGLAETIGKGLQDLAK
jgi:pimeloyl-ACP methyl ester carboxylesterase